MMGPLWGDFLPVPENRLNVPRDADVVEVGNLAVRAVESPGHANHHYAYLVEDVAFVGDVGGVRLGGLKYLRLPMPPPEFNIESWRTSVARLRREFAAAGTRFIAPTHFGLHDDPDWQLAEIERSLDEVEAWMEETMPRDLPIEELREEFIAWTRRQAERKRSGDDRPAAQQAVNPPFMSADGILRYWKKHRQPTSG
jgi:glyoxylase-like metal-dependent hydrolase (beta-lactamase superfamily II)